MMDYQKILIENQDEKYKNFQAKLIPSVSPDSINGVRTPVLRKLAKDMLKEMTEEEKAAFFSDIPHASFEEMQLHAFMISGLKDFKECIEELERFLPYIDNWATCDQLSPKVFKKKKEDLLLYIDQWLASDHTYTIRFGVGMLMEHFLDGDFKVEYAEMVASVRSEEYYVNMMIAWYFATALAKQYDDILPFIENQKLEKWTHNKAIQKARESYRITPEQKEFLKGLKQ